MKELIKLLDQLEKAVSWSDVCFNENYGTEQDELRLSVANKELSEMRMKIIDKFRKLDNKRFKIKNFAHGNKKPIFDKNKED